MLEQSRRKGSKLRKKGIRKSAPRQNADAIDWLLAIDIIPAQQSSSLSLAFNSTKEARLFSYDAAGLSFDKFEVGTPKK
jgi:hypothetical protein